MRLAPRLAQLSSVSSVRNADGSADFMRINWSPMTMGARTLLRSWAMPPASVPMLSMRCVRRNCSSIRFFSVMSVLTIRTDFGRPSSSFTTFQRVYKEDTTRKLYVTFFAHGFPYKILGIIHLLVIHQFVRSIPSFLPR